MARFRQKLMKLDELTPPGWEDTADYIRENNQLYSIAELWVPAVITPQTEDDEVAPAPTSFGELMDSLDIVPGISQMPHGTPWLGSSQIRLGSRKRQSNTRTLGLAPTVEPNSSLLPDVKRIELVCVYSCIWPPQRITI